MPRFTITDLRMEIVKVNGWMESHGWPERLEERGRNGYQAVDEYSVDANGDRIGSGVNCNVCCGTSRECRFEVHNHYNDLHRRRAMV